LAIIIGTDQILNEQEWFSLGCISDYLLVFVVLMALLCFDLLPIKNFGQRPRDQPYPERSGSRTFYFDGTGDEKYC
jgi:hypothetical protein